MTQQLLNKNKRDTLVVLSRFCRSSSSHLVTFTSSVHLVIVTGRCDEAQLCLERTVHICEVVSSMLIKYTNND